MRFYAQSEGFVFSVPVRGMSCIPMIVSAVETYNENVSVPVRGMSCIGKSKQT